MDETAQLEMVGATGHVMALGSTPTVIHLELVKPTGPAAAGAPHRRRAYLNLEKVTGKGVSVGYEIYLNLPDGADPHRNEHLFAGLLPLFGLEKASRTDRGHLGSGLHYVIEITDILDVLQAQPDWKSDDLRITFVPRRQCPSDVQVRVGRVSIYYS